MVFDRNIGGMRVRLRIDGYLPPGAHEYGRVWCDCGFSFRFGEIIGYAREHDELFMPEEVDELAALLTDLLDGKIGGVREVPMMEPDFVFLLYPEKDPGAEPAYTYAAPGFETRDVYAEWRVFLWDEGLTDNYFTITLKRADVEALRDFLNGCRGQMNK